MPKLNYKAINFDLDTKKLKEYYPKRNWLKAYSDIKAFMKSNNFTHRQWSGYRSIEPLSDTQILVLIKKLKQTFPWISQCVRHFDVTNIGKTFDMYPLLTSKDDIPEKNAIEVPKNNISSPKEQTLNEIMAAAHAKKLELDRQRAENKKVSIEKQHDSDAR